MRVGEGNVVMCGRGTSARARARTYHERAYARCVEHTIAVAAVCTPEAECWCGCGRAHTLGLRTRVLTRFARARRIQARGRGGSGQNRCGWQTAEAGPRSFDGQPSRGGKVSACDTRDSERLSHGGRTRGPVVQLGLQDSQAAGVHALIH